MRTAAGDSFPKLVVPEGLKSAPGVTAPGATLGLQNTLIDNTPILVPDQTLWSLQEENTTGSCCAIAPMNTVTRAPKTKTTPGVAASVKQLDFEMPVNDADQSRQSTKQLGPEMPVDDTDHSRHSYTQITGHGITGMDPGGGASERQDDPNLAVLLLTQ